VALRGIGPLHHPQVRAASRRGASAVSADGIGTASSEPGVEMLVGVPVGRRGPRGVGCFRRVRFRCLPMSPMIQMTVPCGVTPMRHDGRTEPGCIRCVGRELGRYRGSWRGCWGRAVGGGEVVRDEDHRGSVTEEASETECRRCFAGR
jgi:hypothetical protein